MLIFILLSMIYNFYVLFLLSTVSRSVTDGGRFCSHFLSWQLQWTKFSSRHHRHYSHCHSNTTVPQWNIVSHCWLMHSSLKITLVCDARLRLPFYSLSCSHPCVEKEDGKTPEDEKGPFRRCWEIYHATSGFISVAIGLVQVCKL